jgi:shikimate dehydrogenase
MQSQTNDIGARTGLVGLFGHPVGHSLSPAMQNAAFRCQDVDMVYLAFDVPPGRLAPAIDGMRALGMRGANVTVPHKEAVVPLLDDVHPLAARVGAVNTILNEDGSLCGHNTDVSGFIAALHSVLPRGARGLDCLLSGAGGAARAVVAALLEEGAATVWIYNRTFARAESLCDAAAEWGPSVCEAVSERRLRDVLPAAQVVVNATPLGLESAVKDFPLPVDTLHSGQVVVDLAYGALTTGFVEAARGKGAIAIDGREMLLMQAAGSYTLWTGLEPPIEAMRGGIASGER